MQWAGSLNMRPMPAECTSALGGWCGGPGLPTTVLPVRPPRLFSPPEATVPGQLETAPGNGAEFAAPAVGGGGGGVQGGLCPREEERRPQRGGSTPRRAMQETARRRVARTRSRWLLPPGRGDVPSRPPGPGTSATSCQASLPRCRTDLGVGSGGLGGQGGDSGRDINMAALLAAGRRSSVFGSCPRKDAFAGGQRL